MASPLTVRLLDRGDEPIVRMLAEQDADFDVEGRGEGQPPLSAEQTTRYLSHPDVLHWVAQVDGQIVGHLLCYIEHRRRGSPRQFMVYEIGVRSTWRRQGVGRALIEAMKARMASEGVTEAWVLADTAALDFYSSCGFDVDADQPVQMSLNMAPND